MGTVRDTIVAPVLRLVGAVASGESPSSMEANDALLALNTMLDAWSASSLLVYNVIPVTFTTTGASSYTVGPTGTWATIYPNKITGVSTFLNAGSSSFEQPVTVYDDGQWNSLGQKNTAGNFLQGVYIDNSFPNRTISLWPVLPAGYLVKIYLGMPVAPFLTLDDVVQLPPGYLEAIIYNLAARLCVEYGKSPDGVIVQLATTSIATIKRANIKTTAVRNDATLIGISRGSFNNRTGM